MSAEVYDTSRITKISKIMPQFSKVAAPGDTVLMGLEGDPAYPYTNTARPSATITDVSYRGTNTYDIGLKLDDGSRKTVSSMTINPEEVFEYDDKSFENVLRREQENMNRAEGKLESSRAENNMMNDDMIQSLRSEITTLRKELNAQVELTRNFHNTYIATLNEVASDMCQMDASGENAKFCRTFHNEYSKMQTRAENAEYRGAEDAVEEDDDVDSMQSDVDEFTDYF